MLISVLAYDEIHLMLNIFLLPMLRKVLLTLFVIIALAGGMVGYLYYQNIKVPVSPAINAVPNTAGFIIQTRNTKEVWKKIAETNIMWKDLIGATFFSEIHDQISWIDSVASSNSTIENIFKETPLFISSHNRDSGKFDLLFNMGLPSGFNDKDLDELIKSSAPPDAYFSQRVFESTLFNELKTKSSNRVFAYALTKGTFIASFSPLLVEASIKQLNSGKPISEDPAFNKVYNTSGNNSEVNLYINHAGILPVAATVLNDTGLNQFASISRYAKYTACDINIKPNAVSFNGFSYVDDAGNNFLSVFKDQQPHRATTPDIMPSNTATFAAYELSNFNSFYKSYQNFLNKNAKLAKVKTALSNIESQNKVDVEDLLLSWMGNETVSFITEPDNETYTGKMYLSFKANSADIALQKLKSFSERIGRSNANEEPDDKKGEKKSEKKKKKKTGEEDAEPDDVVISADQVDSAQQQAGPVISDIYQLKFKNVWGYLLGDFYSGVTENYWVAIDQYIVFANSGDALKELVDYYKNDRVLSKSESYMAFAENLSAESNIFIYSNIARSPYFYSNKLKDDIKTSLIGNLDLIRKFEAIAIQVSAKKDLFYNNIYLKHNPTYKKETNSLWEVVLDAPVSGKPKVVINHTNDTKEIFAQDESNNIYLISNKGEILWKRKMNEKVMSDITQIDRYKNNKLQYLFNTKSAIYMLDRNGKDCEGFPVMLKHPATNTVSIFDYENNRDYRFMIACENKRVYNYSPDGQPVNGWEFTLMKNNVTQPVQHFIINEKDYILAIDIAGEIRLVDRKGKAILEFTQRIPVARNSTFHVDKGRDLQSSSIIATDSLGNVLQFKFSDKLDILNVRKAGKMHYFDYKDINGDKKRDYIYCDANELSVYDQDKSLLINYKFSKPIKHAPMFFLFPGGDSKLGIVSSSTNEIFLINNKGSIEQGFPKYGSTPFSIGDITQDNKFNVIVGAADRHIYLYDIKPSDL